MALVYYMAGGDNRREPFVKARNNIIERTRPEGGGRVRHPGFYTVNDFSVVSDQEGKGRMVSLIHGPHLSFGPDPGDGSEAGIFIFNRLSYEGQDTDPITMIGGEFLEGQSRVSFMPIAHVGYTPIPE